MKRFVLNRKKDISGVSGTGVVAEGVQFSNGKVAMQWLTAMPTLETADSIESILRIHGHGGASEIEWIDDPDKQQFDEDGKSTLLDEQEDSIKKALDLVTNGSFVSVEFNLNPLQRLLKAVYVTIDGDNMGNTVAQAEEKDDEQGARKLSNRINAGLNLFKEFIKRQGGYIIELGGDEGLGKIPKLKLDAIKQFVNEYKDLTGFTLTVGVGKKMSLAANARMLGKLKGKNRIEVWGKDSKKELEKLSKEDSEEDTKKKLKNAGLIKSKDYTFMGWNQEGSPIFENPHHPGHNKFSKDDHDRASHFHLYAADHYPNDSQERKQHLDAANTHRTHGNSIFNHDNAEKPAGFNPNYLRKSSKTIAHPGERGGHVVGHTKSGNPIYESQKKESTSSAGPKPPSVPKAPKNLTEHARSWEHPIGHTGIPSITQHPSGIPSSQIPHMNTPIHLNAQHPAHENFTTAQHQDAAKLHHYYAHLYPIGHEMRNFHERQRNEHAIASAEPHKWKKPTTVHEAGENQEAEHHLRSVLKPSERKEPLPNTGNIRITPNPDYLRHLASHIHYGNPKGEKNSK